MKKNITPIRMIYLILIVAFLFNGFIVHAQKFQLSDKTSSANKANMEMNVLFENGSFVTDSGGGPAGSNLSVLQDITLGMNFPGFDAGVVQNRRVSDEFVVPEHWRVGSIEFFVYQTGSTTNSTINHINLKIWNGSPEVSGSEVIWGDDNTNVVSNTIWTNSYRVRESSPTESIMPIMSVTAEVPDLVFEPGTYWIDVQFDGLLGSGPWVVPITMVDSTTTGNALQSNNGVWTTMMDIGQQGIPFIVKGEVLVCVPPINITGEYVYYNWGDFGAEICWDGSEGLGEWISYDDGENVDGVGGPELFMWAIKFDSSQLINYSGASLTKILIYNKTSDAKELHIYKGTNCNYLLHTQTMTNLPIEAWSEVILTDPVLLDISKPLWIAVYTDDGANYPAGCGLGMGEPNGDLITFDGYTWEHLSDYGIDNTWNLSGYVTTLAGATAALPMESPKDKYNCDSELTLGITGLGNSANSKLIESDVNRALSGFNIYRSWHDDDYDLVVSLPAIIGVTHYCYYDYSCIGDYFYQVTSFNTTANDNCESVPGTALINPLDDFVYVLVTDINSNESSVSRMYPNPANDKVTIESSNMNRVTVTNTVGQVVFDAQANGSSKVTLNTANYEAGVYVVRIETAAGSETQRVTIVR